MTFDAAFAALQAALESPLGADLPAACGAFAAALGTLYAKSETFRTIVGTIWTDFSTRVQEMWAIVQPLLTQLWELIVAGYEYLRDNVDWAALWADLQPALAAAQELLTTFVQSFIAAVTTVVTFVRENWSTIGPIVKASIDIAVASVQLFLSVVTPIIQTISALINGDFSDAWTHAGEAVKAMAEGIGKILTILAVTIGRLAVAAMKALWEAFKDGVEKAVDFVAGLPDKAVTALSALAGLLKTVGSNAMTGLWNGLKNIWEDVSGWLKDRPGKIQDFFSNAGRWLWSAGSSIMTGLLDGIKNAWENVANYLSGLGEKIKGLKGPLDKDRKLLVPEGRAIMDGLLAGMQSGSTGVLDFASRFADSIAVGGAPAAALAGGGSSSLVINVDARGATNPALVEAAAERGARRALVIYAGLKHGNGSSR